MAEGLRAPNSSPGDSVQQSVGLNPGCDTCVLEQNTLLYLLLFTQGNKWVSARVEVDILYEKKAFRAPQ